MRRELWISGLVWILAAVGVVSAQSAEEIRVTPIVAEGTVAASFAAGGAIDAAAREMVQSGLVVTFTFVVDLKRPSIWWDRTIASQTVSSTIKFDNLTGTYHVSRIEGGHVTWSERTKDFAEARVQMTSFARVLLADNGDLEPNAEYYVEVRMRASPRRTFPLWPWGHDDSIGRSNFTYIR